MCMFASIHSSKNKNNNNNKAQNGRNAKTKIYSKYNLPEKRFVYFWPPFFFVVENQYD